MVDTTMMNERYLMHHGVKGMKWGARHDPEKVGRGTSSLKLSNKQKKILKRVAIGAAITGGVLLASYGGIKVNDIRNYKKISKAAKDATQSVLRKENREAIIRAKELGAKHSFGKNFIIDDYKQSVEINRKRAIEEEKKLVTDGYEEYKKLRNAKIRDIINPSPFGKRAKMYDPYKMINYYRNLYGV